MLGASALHATHFEHKYNHNTIASTSSPSGYHLLTSWNRITLRNDEQAKGPSAAYSGRRSLQARVDSRKSYHARPLCTNHMMTRTSQNR